MFPEGGKPGFAKNIRVVEWLKADLISSTAALFKAMLKGSEEKLLDALSGLIINLSLIHI